MKKTIFVLMIVFVCRGWGAVPAPSTTVYTRGLLITTNSTEARTYLGVGATQTNTTIIVTNLTVINTNTFNVGKGGHLTVSNSFTILTNVTFSVQNLPLPAVLVVGTNGILTNATLSNITLSNDGVLAASGDTTGTNIVTLTMAGTNVSSMDFSLVQRGGIFKLVLTGNAYVGAPANVATSPFSKAWMLVQQPSTGTCLLQFTNGHFAWPEGVSPVMSTNGGDVALFEFVSDVFTNSILHGVMVPLSKLATNM